MAIFIKVIIVIYDENDKQIGEEPSLLNLDMVESFRVTDGRLAVYYKDRNAKTGNNWIDYLKGGSLDLVNELLAKGATVLK